MRSRFAKLLLTAAALAGYLAATTAARAPVTRNNRQAQLVVRYVETPTAFAFSPHKVFMSDGTRRPLGLGGVYVVEHGVARRLRHSPPFSFGLAWYNRTLFISAGRRLLAWKGWNGRNFTRQRTIYQAPPGSTGFNGLAIGSSGRLYVGVDKGTHNDHGPPSAPYQYDVLSMTRHGRDVEIVAQGIRQPWQLAFPTGSSSPFVTDLGQDSGARHPPDLLLRVRKRQDYGFPGCNWVNPARCQAFARPLRFFAPHTDPMGLAILGGRLYLSEFGAATPAQVISIPLGGGPARVELSGFSAGRNIVGLGANDGWIYVGEIAAGRRHAGSVWRFRP
jgi:glucose/arabinose dehydrogenase